MEMTGWKGNLYLYGNWALKLAYLNLLWIGGILIGAFLAGFFPSTVAMFAVIRKWKQNGGLELPLYHYFKNEYKREFIKANLYGYVWVTIGAILYVDLLFFRSIPALWGTLVSFLFFILGVIYLAALLFAFPVYVQFDLRITQYVKNAILIALSNPIYTVLMALGFYFPYYLMIKIPGLLPFFGGSLIVLSLMSLSLKLFEILDQKANEHKEL